MSAHTHNQSGETPTEDAVEEESVQEAAALSPKLIYEVIRRDGEEELARTKLSLLWSGIAAGMLIKSAVSTATVNFIICEGVLR